MAQYQNARQKSNPQHHQQQQMLRRNRQPNAIDRSSASNSSRRSITRSITLSAITTMLMTMLMLLVVGPSSTSSSFGVEAFSLPAASNRIQARSSATALAAKSGGKEIRTEQQFQDIVLSENTNKAVLVFFTAPWCGPCRLSTPVVKDIMKQFSKDIQVVEVCTDDLAEVAAECGVTSIPTIQFYYGNQLLDTIVGCVAKSVLASAVTKVLDDVAVFKQSRQK